MIRIIDDHDRIKCHSFNGHCSVYLPDKPGYIRVRPEKAPCVFMKGNARSYIIRQRRVVK